MEIEVFVLLLYNRLITQLSCTFHRSCAVCEHILNKTENATPELFAIYIQNNANQEYN